MSTATPAPLAPRTPTGLRVALTVLGVLSTIVAVNVAFGGMATLGMQGPTDYFDVTDRSAYLVRDSHMHYYGGVYVALGVFLVVAARDVNHFRSHLLLIFGMIFAGGLARLTQFEPSVTFGSDLASSTAIELIGMPLLAMWVVHVTRGRPATPDVPATSERSIA